MHILKCNGCGNQKDMSGPARVDPEGTAQEFRDGEVVYFQSIDQAFHICSECVLSAAQFLVKAKDNVI